jgi:Uma2 family endonuclease
MKISELWAPEPDIMFIATYNPSQINETFLDGPASVVFEILSPSTRNGDIERKLSQYLSAGVEEIWIIDPINQRVEIHSPENLFSYLENDWAISNAIIGFKIKPSWLWNSETMPILDALNEINTE